MYMNNLRLDLICFTGSTYVGSLIAQTAAKNLTPCILELGGKCPVVVDEGADIDFTAKKIAETKASGSGQICINADYILVHSSLLDQFVTRVQQHWKDMFGENPEESAAYSRIINEFHTDRIGKLITTAGGEILCGGTFNIENKYISPTIILNPDKESEIMKEEIFGPVLPVYSYDDISEAINFINSKEKPLTVYYFGKTGSANERRVANETSSGTFMTNEMLLQFLSNYLGFGGVGQSGSGRHGGYEGFKNFSNRKGMILKGPAPGFVLNMITPPYDDDKQKKVLGAVKGSM